MNKKISDLNTSVEATFKNGETQCFDSIEEASKITGISVQSIKIRANKGKSCKGKDGISFRWLDDHTARHYRAKKSKNKGKDLEYEIVEKLKGIGYANVCRSAGESKKLDNMKVDIADPSGELEIAIQAKHYANFPNYFNIKSECPDPRDFVLIWKKSAEGGSISKGTVAVMDVDFFYKLLEIYHRQSK